MNRVLVDEHKQARHLVEGDEVIYTVPVRCRITSVTTKDTWVDDRKMVESHGYWKTEVIVTYETLEPLDISFSGRTMWYSPESPVALAP